MSRPAGLEVDAAAGIVRWRNGDEEVRARVPDAVDARFDDKAGRIVVLRRKVEGEGVAILSRSGEALGSVSAPTGYRISHFADAGRATLVCQGEEQDGAWWDWHFELDDAGAALRRTGPAY